MLTRCKIGSAVAFVFIKAHSVDIFTDLCAQYRPMLFNDRESRAANMMGYTVGPYGLLVRLPASFSTRVWK
ncbi:hypothetical protein BDV09DRAFT_179837 [Aspergillus tetrazonus]